MSSGMPELGSKISLISKADIRYEGRLFTVDPQECTIALASVRSFGTEDRETQYPVAPQSQVYDYILFRGSDIKDIRVLNNVPSLPNDPAIMQMSVPPSLGGGSTAPQFASQYNHPIVGQTQYPQYHPMAGFPGSVHTQLNKTSELSPQTDLAPQPQPTTGPIGSGVAHHANQVKDQGSMLDLIGGGSQQNASGSGTPAVGHRKSPTADQGTQVGTIGGPGANRTDTRRGSTSNQKQGQNRNRTSSRNRQRYPSGGPGGPGGPGGQAGPGGQDNRGPGAGAGPAGPSAPQHNAQQAQQQQQHYHHQTGQGYNRGGWRGRSRGRGRGFIPRNKNTLKFENDYDFEQANTEFEELRSQLAKTKITDGDVKSEGNTEYEELRNQLDKTKITDGDVKTGGETDKKDDSGNETGAGEPEVDEDGAFTAYDKNKSFFDNISCEAVERSKGRSQRTDWRTERKLNSETFGVASARRGAWRGRGGWRHNPHHQPMSYFPSWRPSRGGRGRPHPGNMMNMNQPQPNNRQRNQPSNPAPVPSQPQVAATAK